MFPLHGQLFLRRSACGRPGEAEADDPLPFLACFLGSLCRDSASSSPRTRRTTVQHARQYLRQRHSGHPDILSIPSSEYMVQINSQNFDIGRRNQSSPAFILSSPPGEQNMLDLVTKHESQIHTSRQRFSR